MLQALSKEHSERFGTAGEALAGFRRENLEQAMLCGLPSRKNESWHFTPVQIFSSLKIMGTRSRMVMDSSQIEPYRIKEAFLLLFVNGCFNSEISDVDSLEGLTIVNLAKSIKSQFSSIKQKLDRFEKNKSHKSDMFYRLSNAYLEDGLILQVKPNVKLARPIQILNLITEAEPLAFFNNIFIDIGAHSSCEIIETHIGDVAGLSTFRTQSHLYEGAKLEYTRHSELRGVQVDLADFILSKDASLNVSNLLLNPGLGRSQISVYLSEQGASANLFGLSLLDGKEISDNQINVEHLVPHCTSRQVFKGVLSGQSKSIFSGRIFIAEGANGTDSAQLCKNLVLSRTAEADVKPQLEVYADDVKANHGAAIGRFDPEELFYLQSRGIPKQEAVSMLANAFVEDILNNIKSTVVRKKLADKFLEKFSRIDKEDLYGI